VYLLAGQNEEQVRKALSENFGDLEINYVPEEDSKGNAAALANLETRISEPFVVVNGHVLADVDISEMFDMHRNNSSVATIALTAVQDPSKYGAARLKGDKILGFEEKPEKGGEPSKLINAGTYIFDPSMFDYLSSDSIETVFEKLAEEGELSGYIYGGKWIDVSS
jgi:NDP-sugar pyrophosphorylase family protein